MLMQWTDKICFTVTHHALNNDNEISFVPEPNMDGLSLLSSDPHPVSPFIPIIFELAHRAR
jgi:hypothetical protein